MDWERCFADKRAWWEHDGNPKRPYALLTSGDISDFYFDGSKVTEDTLLLEKIVTELTGRIKNKPDAVVAPALGATTLGYEVARQLRPALAWFAEPVRNADGTIKQMDINRFEPHADTKEVLQVEDVITSGKTTTLTTEAIYRLDASLLVQDSVLCIINRSGLKRLPTGMQIVSLLSITPKTWKRGENPFTPDGQELVEPVRPKKNWVTLTREYT